jgi:SOS response regulatory protein OraA/RecX
VARLLGERAIDDHRVAGAIARTETATRKRGRLRVQRRIESAGIAPATARRALDEVFGGLDADELLESALAKRLRRGTDIADEREFNRLYRYLLGQGFEPAQVLARLKRNHKV